MHPVKHTQSPNFINSVIGMKCPCCRKGKLFKKRWPVNFRELEAMHEKCEVCGTPTEMEHGFYYGAMYAAYALTVAIFVTIWVAYTVLAGSVFETPFTFLAIDISITILLTPFTFRMARSIWAHLFIKFDPKAGKQ